MALSVSAILAIPVAAPVYAQGTQDFISLEADKQANDLPDNQSGDQTDMPSENKRAASGGEAVFLSGTNFNARIKEIAGNSGANFSSEDFSIKAVVWEDPASIPEEAKNEENKVSTSSSEVPIYSWFDGESGTLSISSEADTAYLNEESNFMFYRLGALEELEMIEHVDSSNTSSMINMFGECGALVSLDLSAMTIQDDADMNDMFTGCDGLTNLTLGSGWQFATATGIPKYNWSSSKTGEVWTYAALETRYTGTDAADFTVTQDVATVEPEEILYEGTGLGENNMYPVDDPSQKFTGFCINDENQDPYGYYRRVEIPAGESIGEEWFHSNNFGYEPIGSDMREALITLAVEGTAAMEAGTMGYNDLQKDIWHFTNHYSDAFDNESFWADKNFENIENHENMKLYLYESLEGKQNVLSIEGVEVPEPEPEPETFSVVISKQSEDGIEIAGAHLVLSDGTGKHVAEWTTEERKNYTVNGLLPGSYKLSELDAPEGFLKADAISFSISEDGKIVVNNKEVSKIVMVDEKEPEEDPLFDVEISKQDISGEEIAGARLTISDSQGNHVETWTSVAGENHIVKGLPAGNYKLSEITAPDGFEKAEAISFSIDEKGNVMIGGVKKDMVVMVDEYIDNPVVISKQDIAGEEIPGAELTVTDEDGKVIDSWTSEAGKSHIIEGLTEGEFILTEETAPKGYEKAESIKFTLSADGTVTVNGSEVDKVVMTDEYTEKSVVISKQDVAGAEIAGAELTVTDEDGNVVDTWTSEEGRSHAISGLYPGTFTLTEKTAPEGYEKAESIRFTILADSTVQVNGESVDKVVMTDEYIPVAVTIRKIENTKSVETLITGAKMSLLDKDGKAVVSWTTDGKEKVVSLDPGEYQLVETEAPEGFEIAEPIKFTVNLDGTVTLEGESKPQDDAVITMVDEVSDGTQTVKILKTGMDDSPLSGATLKVSHEEDGHTRIDKQWKTDDEEMTLKLVPGKYLLEEESAPTGYIAADDIEFVVQPSGKILVDDTFVETIVVKNEPTLVGFSKVDADTDERISGARLQVMTKDGDVLEEWTSNEHVHHITGKLGAGETYILHEASAPEGYEVAEDIEFTVNKDASELSVKMKDKAIPVEEVEYGTLQVFKNVEGSGADTSKMFAFVIALMDEDNEPFTGSLPYVMSNGLNGDLKFDSNGKAGFELSHGQYILFRKVPAGLYYTVTEMDYTKEGYTPSVRDNAAETKEGENIITFVNTYGTQTNGSAAGTGTGSSSNSASGTVTTSRDTGDASYLFVWIGILVCALVAGAAGIIVYRKKKR